MATCADSLYVSALASCSSIVWRDHNLPRGSNDTSEAQCCKILDVANRINEENDQASPCPFIHHSEKGRFKECVYSIKNITAAVRELGHGTGKLLTETSPGNFNFDQENLPDNPLTGERVSTWYQLGQTWTSVFGSIAVSVEECRAEAISLFLMDNKELLSLFGCDDTSPIRPDNRACIQGIPSLFPSFLHPSKTNSKPGSLLQFSTTRIFIWQSRGCSPWITTTSKSALGERPTEK